MLLATTLVRTSPVRAGDAASPTVTLSPTQAPVGTSVTIQPEIYDPITYGQTCSVFWDGNPTPAATFPCGTDDSNAFATADLPAEGPPGKHQITVHCDPGCSGSISESGWQATAVFVTLSTVPELLGLSYADARIQQRLHDAGLQLGSRTGPTDPHAIVTSQIPKADAIVQPDTPVDLAFELPQRHPQLVTVPDLLNLFPADAATLLTANQLALGTVTGTGRIAKQDPQAFSRVARGTPINIVLARPVTLIQPITVPDLTGLTVEDATQLLAAHRLKLGDVTGTGRVIEQDPPAQSNALPFSRVKVRLRQRQVPMLVTVPDLRGLTEPDAARLLDAYPLTLGTVTGSGRVSRQAPAAGKKVPRGTAIALTLTAPAPVLVTVPDIRGLKLADAGTRTGDDGLKLATGGAVTGVVVGQQPAAGSRVPKGTTVAATVLQPAVILAAAAGPIPWAEIAILALAIGLVSTAGWLTPKRRPTTGAAPRRLPRRYPPAGKHIDVRCQATPPKLKVTTVGSTAFPVGITVHGRDPNIMVKEVQK